MPYFAFHEIPYIHKDLQLLLQNLGDDAEIWILNPIYKVFIGIHVKIIRLSGV